MNTYDAVLAAPGVTGALHAYLDDLIGLGDPRAEAVAGLLAALSGDGSQLVPDDTPWGVSMGLPLARALEAEGHLDALPALLASTRMGLEFLVGGPPTTRTRFFGDPDLPPGLPWPTHGDCVMWEPLPEIAAELPCRFVCQIDLAALGGPGLPRLEGLLSVFVFQEYDEYGSAGVVLHHFAAGTELVTRPHPACDEANAKQPPEGARIRPVRMLPGRWGVWEDLATADEAAWDVAWEALSSHVHGAFGHLRGTTGGDPTPSRRHHRLLAVPCDEEGVLNIHLAIDEDALAAGRLQEFALAWVDFDGG